MPTSRTIHYYIALWSAVFISISAITGLLWAYAPYLYWQSGYKEKKRKIYEVNVTFDKLPLSEIAKRYSNPSSPLKEVLLTSKTGREVYILTFIDQKKVLIDATTGEELSPLSEPFAKAIAEEYSKEGRIVKAVLDNNWEDRKGTFHKPAWILSFDDPQKTEIVLDAANGEVLEDSDEIRRFHFWVMKLHQFNFFGTHKVLTALSGVPLLVLIITGSVLSLKRLRYTRRKERL